MGLLGKLFSRPPEDPRSALEAAATARSGEALELLARAGRAHHSTLGIEGELHDDYASAALRAWGDGGHLPSVEVAAWQTWAYPTCALVLERAGQSSAEILYLQAPEARRTGDALAELEALRLLRDDSTLVLVTIGEEDALLRTSFAAHLGAVEHPDAEEVIQELVDTAGKVGLKTAFI
jgi:hypothetical protein